MGIEPTAPHRGSTPDVILQFASSFQFTSLTMLAFTVSSNSGSRPCHLFSVIAKRISPWPFWLKPSSTSILRIMCGPANSSLVPQELARLQSGQTHGPEEVQTNECPRHRYLKPPRNTPALAPDGSINLDHRAIRPHAIYSHPTISGHWHLPFSTVRLSPTGHTSETTRLYGTEKRPEAIDR